MFLSKDHSALVQGLRDIRKITVRVWNLHMVALSVRGHLYSGISAASFYQEIQWPNWLQLLQAACNSRIGKSRVKKTPPGLNLYLQSNF